MLHPVQIMSKKSLTQLFFKSHGGRKKLLLEDF